MRPWAILALLFAILSLSGEIYRPSHSFGYLRPVVNLPLEAFWGIPGAESDYYAFAIGRDGFDQGFWQVRSFYNQERGIKNAFDVVETTRWAVKNFQQNLAYFGDIDKAISAHKRGRHWVEHNGIDREYLRRVKGEK